MPSVLIHIHTIGMIRIWKWPKGRPRAIHPTLVVSLANHSSHINSITFAKDGSRFFTADGNGVIKVWSDTFFTGSTYLDNMGKRARRAHSMARTQEKSSDRMLEDIENKIEMQDSDGGSSSGTFTERTRASIVQSEPDFRERFKLIRSIAHERLQGDGINCIVYHSRPERLIVYCKSGALYLFSLLRYDLRKHFTGSATNHRRLRCCISPDGNYLAAGSEDGKAYFYNITTGRLEMKLDVGLTHPMCDIAWHPSQHQVAFCSFGADLPILTYEYAVPDSTTTINLNF